MSDQPLHQDGDKPAPEGSKWWDIGIIVLGALVLLGTAMRIDPWTGLVIVAVLVGTYLWQMAWCRFEENEAWISLSKPKDMPDGFKVEPTDPISAVKLTVPEGTKLALPPGATVTDAAGAPHELPSGATLSPPNNTMTLPEKTEVMTSNIIWQAGNEILREEWARPKGQIQAFTWGLERGHWAEEASKTRQTYLTRTQATADKWRNVFAALLAVFGAVLFIKPALPAGQPMERPLYWFIMLALITAIQAVAYTGWAGAGLPRRMMNVTAETLFCHFTTQGAHAVIRLRIGLFMGGVSAFCLLLAVAALLSSGMG